MYILQVKNLYKKYDKTEAIAGVDFSIKQGEIYGLLGPNGAGKSTLIKMIAGIENKDEGEIIFEEKERNINKYKRNMGILTQDIAIYPSFTAYENISFFCSLYSFKGKELKRRVEKSLEFVGLSDCKNKKAKEFSGGMMRRLHLACAIAHTPKLIIMDEPTVGIDPQSRNHILQSVKMLKDNGASIIYTSHYMEEIEELCKRVFIIDLGKEIAYGDREEIKSSVFSNNKVLIEAQDISSKTIIDLKAIDGVNNVTEKDNKLSLTISSNFKLGNVLSLMENGGINIKKISYEEAKLEDVFLSLTGKSLRD